MKHVDMFALSVCMGWNWWVWYDYAYGTWLDGWLYICMRLVCMITLCLVGETWLWYGLGRNSMNLLVRFMVAPHGVGRNSMNLLLRSHGGASWFRM